MSNVDFSSFLKLMVHKKASDLFITAGIPPSMKVNGRIQPITQTPLTPQQVDKLDKIGIDKVKEELEELRVVYAQKDKNTSRACPQNIGKNSPLVAPTFSSKPLSKPPQNLAKRSRQAQFR